ncbi:cell division protein FtsL [Candidatus Saccharibacteria bacterium]|nr:cell division protein FtsL [Candidatus Saccharibacteria bacterium]
MIALHANKDNHHMSQTQSNYYTSRRQQNWSRNQNTTRFKSSVKLGPVAHTVLVALMITVLGLIYLTQATRTTGYDYESQKIDSQIADLNNQKSDLQIENARLTALSTIKDSAVAREMTTPVSTEYVQR